MSTFALDHRIAGSAEVRPVNVMAQRSGRSGNVENLVAVFLFIINAKNDALGLHNVDYVTRETNNQTKYNMETKRKEVIEFIKKEMKFCPNVHFIEDSGISINYYCLYFQLGGARIKSIMDKYPDILIYIKNGLLCFNYTYYEK